jgi:hypothetical protein
MASWLYSLGLLIDALLLLLACGSAMTMVGSTITSSDGTTIDTAAGLAPMGWVMLGAIPLALVALMATAAALRKRGSVVAANVLLWLPALPFGISLLFWGGLAVIFALFSRQ